MTYLYPFSRPNRPVKNVPPLGNILPAIIAAFSVSESFAAYDLSLQVISNHKCVPERLVSVLACSMLSEDLSILCMSLRIHSTAH